MSYSQTAAHKRIASLLDEGSFVETGAYIIDRNADPASVSDVNGDGVVTGYGTIEGALVFVYAQNPEHLGGSIGEMHAKKISAVYKKAVEMGAPVIALIDCAGVRVDAGNDSLFSFGRILEHQAKANGVVPQVAAIFGNCGGGLAVSAAMADFVAMETEKGKLFLNSPDAVTGNYTEKLDTAAAKYQAEETGICDFKGTEAEVMAAVREFISLVPGNNEEACDCLPCDDDLNRSVAGIDKLETAAEKLMQISDNGSFMEIGKDFAGSVTAGFIRLNGRTIGAVANNKAQICFKGAKKASDFVNFCDAFNIPVLTLCDVKKFAQDALNESLLGPALGKLIYTYSTITVPQVTVIAGSAFGTAGLSMNSKALGADVVYAWTAAKMGAMDEEALKGLSGADQAAANGALYNAKRGYVDDIIDPAETRQRVAAAFEMLYTKSVSAFPKKHGTI